MGHPETQQDPGPTDEDYPLRVFEPVFPGEHEYEGVSWNDLVHEPGESFEAYRYGYKRGTALRTIRLWPMEKPAKKTRQCLDLAREFLEIAFSSEVTVMDPLETPPGSFNHAFEQYDANAVLNGMIRDTAVDHVSELNLAVTVEDLYASRRAYVFGYADYVHHVGVISLNRLGGEHDVSLTQRRLLKLIRHEVSHMYGMAHCIQPSCIMRGASTRDEADSIPLHMCPSCAAKLVWRIGDDGHQRNTALAAFYKAHFAGYLEKRLLGPPLRGD